MPPPVVRNHGHSLIEQDRHLVQYSPFAPNVSPRFLLALLACIVHIFQDGSQNEYVRLAR